MNGFMDDYIKNYNDYYGHKVSYDEYAKRKNEIIEQCAIEILDSNSPEEIAKEWFKDYGTMNGWGPETSFSYAVAFKLHSHFMDIDHKSHKAKSVDTMRGWHEVHCSCGFGWSCDSGD